MCWYVMCDIYFQNEIHIMRDIPGIYGKFSEVLYRYVRR